MRSEPTYKRNITTVRDNYLVQQKNQKADNLLTLNQSILIPTKTTMRKEKLSLSDSIAPSLIAPGVGIRIPMRKRYQLASAAEQRS